MLKRIEEFNKYVIVTGFKDVKIKDAEQFLKTLHQEKLANTEVQLFDPLLVATWQHLYFAGLNALTAFENQTNISRSLAMETMLYASAQHQIRKATELVGIKANLSDIGVLIIGDNREAVESTLSIVSKLVGSPICDGVLELSPKKIKAIQKAFKISAMELKTIARKNGLEKALIDLVIERMALLATEH